MLEVRPYLEKPAKLWLQVNNTCNQQCVWCYGDCTPQPRADEWTTQQLFDFVDQLVADDVLQIYIEGGEPFHRPDFLDVLRYCRGRLLVWVRTNGSMIDAELAREIKAANVGTMVVDLMAAREETHDYLAGQAGSYRRTVAAIRHLVAENVTLIMSMVLNRRNRDEFQEYVDLAHSLGVRKVALLRPYPIGRMRQRWAELSVGLDEMMKVIDSTVIPDGVHPDAVVASQERQLLLGVRRGRRVRPVQGLLLSARAGRLRRCPRHVAGRDVGPPAAPAAALGRSRRPLPRLCAQ